MKKDGNLTPDVETIELKRTNPHYYSGVNLWNAMIYLKGNIRANISCVTC